MLVKIDASARLFALVNVSDAHGDYRRYYVADAPHLMIVVAHNSLSLGDLPGRVVDAAVGWHEGQYGFVRPGNEDKRHSNLTIYGEAEGKPETTLSDILNDAPKESDERPQP